MRTSATAAQKAGRELSSLNAGTTRERIGVACAMDNGASFIISFKSLPMLFGFIKVGRTSLRSLKLAVYER